MACFHLGQFFRYEHTFPEKFLSSKLIIHLEKKSHMVKTMDTRREKMQRVSVAYQTVGALSDH